MGISLLVTGHPAD